MEIAKGAIITSVVIVHRVHTTRLPKKGDEVETLCGQIREYKQSHNVIGDGQTECADCRSKVCEASGSFSFGVI